MESDEMRIERLEREKRLLLDTLEHAKGVIRTWHDMGTKGQEQLWLIYQQSPEMKKINEAMAQAATHV